MLNHLLNDQAPYMTQTILYLQPYSWYYIATSRPHGTYASINIHQEWPTNKLNKPHLVPKRAPFHPGPPPLCRSFFSSLLFVSCSFCSKLARLGETKWRYLSRFGLTANSKNRKTWGFKGCDNKKGGCHLKKGPGICEMYAVFFQIYGIETNKHSLYKWSS